jgi:hypothetical protein
VEDQFPHMSEFRPYWRRVDKQPPPKGVKLWFKSLHGAAVSGVWYKGNDWAFWSPMPKHSEEDKAWIREQSSASGRFSDGKPYEAHK